MNIFLKDGTYQGDKKKIRFLIAQVYDVEMAKWTKKKIIFSELTQM